MAEVYRARMRDASGQSRLVAVKRILGHIADEEELVEMFIAEAKLAAQLAHPNITQVYDLQLVDDTWFMALELVEGKDVRALFDRCRSLCAPMPIPQACFIALRVGEALDYAYRELRLVHRDVSPQNILVSYDGEVKLTDFGIANARGRGRRGKPGTLEGKLSHMSPEQVRGLPTDHRSDIFSLGIVLHELLTGERLFDGASDLHTLDLIRTHVVPPPRSLNPRMSVGLEEIVLRALAAESEDRYPRARELCDALEEELRACDLLVSERELAAWIRVVYARELAELRARG
jgi:serine/threonine protein kinase